MKTKQKNILWVKAVFQTSYMADSMRKEFVTNGKVQVVTVLKAYKAVTSLIPFVNPKQEFNITKATDKINGILNSKSQKNDPSICELSLEVMDTMGIRPPQEVSSTFIQTKL